MIYADRVKESTTSTGLGDFILAGAPTGFRTFASIIPTGETFYYCIDGGASGEWEIGIGVMTDATTLVRSSVLASSNADAAVSFSAGTKNAFVTIAVGLCHASHRDGTVPVHGDLACLGLRRYPFFRSARCRLSRRRTLAMRMGARLCG